MKLRDHPRMKFRGVSVWPPVWVHFLAQDHRTLLGEVGVLTATELHPEAPTRLFVRMTFEGREYLGCTICPDTAVCRELRTFLNSNIGKSIKEISELDFPDNV